MNGKSRKCLRRSGRSRPGRGWKGKKHRKWDLRSPTEWVDFQAGGQCEKVRLRSMNSGDSRVPFGQEEAT